MPIAEAKINKSKTTINLLEEKYLQREYVVKDNVRYFLTSYFTLSAIRNTALLERGFAEISTSLG